jgi:hypothetical protein
MEKTPSTNPLVVHASFKNRRIRQPEGTQGATDWQPKNMQHTAIMGTSIRTP